MTSEGRAARFGRLGASGVVLLAAAVIALLAIGIAIRRSRVPEAEAAPPPAHAQAATAGTVDDVIGQLERRMRGNTSDSEGWRMLGWSYFQTGRYAEAARAYGQAARIDPKNAQYWSALGEATVLADRAGVSPDAAAAFRRALAIDPKDSRARYFVGVQKDMAGDHKGAVNQWIALLKDTPAGAPWEGDVRRLVAQVAAANRINIAGRLPPPPPGAAAATAAGPAPADGGAAAADAASGPTRTQMEAAAQLPPAAQDAMVQEMVGRLAARLQADPRDADGWIRLMRARMVLNDRAGARGALASARTTFAGDAPVLARLADAAKALGVPGA